MNMFFFDNFDTDTVGSCPAWFNSVSGGWQVFTGGTEFSSPNGFRSVDLPNATVILVGGGGVNIPPIADLIFVHATSNLGIDGSTTPIMRCDDAGQNGYGFDFRTGGGPNFRIGFYIIVSGTATLIGSYVDSGVSAATPHVRMRIKMSCIGSIITCKLWQDGTTEPTSPQFSTTDTTYPGPGRVGFRLLSALGQEVDDVSLSGTSDLAPGTLSASSIASTSMTVATSGVSGGTGTYSYRWYRSTVFANGAFVPQTSNLIAGATSATFNDTGLTPATIYHYMLVASDSTGAIVWSNPLTASTIAASSLTNGGLSSSNVLSTTLTVTDAGASGGTSPYTYQWYRSTSSGFTPGSGNTVSGATNVVLNDTGLTPSTTYYYKNIVTDGASAAAVSSQLTVATSAPSVTLTNGSLSSSNISSTTLTVTDSGASGGTTPYAYQWYRSTSSGFTPGSGNSLSGATSAALNDTGLAPSTTYYYRNVVTDAASATATSSQLTVTTSAFAPVIPGSVLLTYVGSRTTQLSGGYPSGGTAPYAYQWLRSTSPNSGFTSISGATSETVLDTGLTPSTTYYYKLQYTDASSSTTNSIAVQAVTLPTSNEEIIGGIGDSIMMGVFSTFENPFSVALDQMNYRLEGTKVFTGVNRGASGTTSTQWTDTTSGSLLSNTIVAFNAAGVTRVMIALGGNDASQSNSTLITIYKANINSIINTLFNQISTLRSVSLLSPIYMSLTTGNISQQDCARLIAYAGALSQIANGTTVFCSYPLETYNLFQANPTLLRSDGTHPTDIGDQALGAMWASCVINDITPSAGSTLSGYSRSRIANE